MDERIKTTDFVTVRSTDTGAYLKKRSRRQRGFAGKRRKGNFSAAGSYSHGISDSLGVRQFSEGAQRRRAHGNGGLLLLLGVCTSAFMLLFILQIVRTEYAPDALAVMRSVLNNTDITDGDGSDDKNADDTLGKLQLVQLPSILEVFSPSDSPVPPLAMSNAVVDEESLTAKIYAPKGTMVASVLPGTVKSADIGGELGGCVVVSHENDIDVYYYGLNEIMVERGQPILQNSSIGTLAGDVLYLRVTKEGRPIDPFEFLGIKAEVGG